MSEENVQLVREGLAAMEQADVETLLEQAHPEIEWVNPDYAVEPGTRHGLGGYRKAIEATHDSFEELQFEVIRMEWYNDAAQAYAAAGAAGGVRKSDVTS